MREHTPATDLLAAWPGATFTTSERLYHLTGLGPAAALAQQLLIESWTLHEALSQPYVLQIHALATDARLPVGDLLGQFLVLHTLLADGSRSPRSGIVLATQALESDGGLARFALTLGPWSALNQHVFGSGLHQGVTAAEIAERSWRRLAPRADWAWAADVAGHLSRSPFHEEQAASPGRRLCSQYRETDHAFIQRLLAEEGIGYAFEEVEAADADDAAAGDDGLAPAGRSSGAAATAADPTSSSATRVTSPHRLSAFADSTVLPWDDTVQRDGAIRFHQAGATQAQD
ncbi:MAG: hypothetical protein MK041_12665, partial [Aquabacterium sp.]|nr:hypothetical protein [Aquabacterium sp.]